MRSDNIQTRVEEVELVASQKTVEPVPTLMHSARNRSTLHNHFALRHSLRCSLLLSIALLPTSSVGQVTDAAATEAESIRSMFNSNVKPLITKYCLRCHNDETMESGIRLDRLNGTVADKNIRFWEGIRHQLADHAMPPEDKTQPTPDERKTLVEWIARAIKMARSRPAEFNGSVRRMTVAQYRNTLRDLLKLNENVTDILPPDAVSKDGFTNNSQSMLLSPLQVEAYFEIAEKALDLCIVDPTSKPTIQKFRMDLGKNINANPLPEKLILGANNHLLENADFVVTEPVPQKSFEFEPLAMRTKFRFNEGYQGNSTVRGWRDYDSIYHAVFACMRGNPGYPKGRAYEPVVEGLLLRPAIPSAELFGVESTYGPRANFKVSLRELPGHGNFRVTVRAARYDDGLLLDPGDSVQPRSQASAIAVNSPNNSQSIKIESPGIYQADVYLQSSKEESRIAPDDSMLSSDLIGAWTLSGDIRSTTEQEHLTGRLEGGATFVDSPFGQGVSLDGVDDFVVVERDDSMNVADGDFTVAAWINPQQLRQGGIVCLGRYSWTHGWYLDMPNNKGVLRIETVSPQNKPNGTVQSRPGVIRAKKWQHVAAVVRRGTDETLLFVNGYQVAKGTIDAANLDNPAVDLHIGRIQDSALFKGTIDEVHFYRRALGAAEIQALVEPGRKMATPPPPEKPRDLALNIGQRRFTRTLSQPAFLVARLPAGPVDLSTEYSGQTPIEQVVLTRLDESDETAKRFAAFEKRMPQLGVHVGLRRDCGSTLSPVGVPQTVSESEFAEFVFEGAINNFPSPDVEDSNDNYLAGVREIGVRSEYTNGRDMPRLLLRSVEFEGPFYESWPPLTHQNIFIQSTHQNDSPQYAREIIRNFATRAFRRPITDSEAERLFSVWHDSMAAGGSFQSSIKEALLAVLTSPQFLLLIEKSQSPQPEDLNAFELASKLAYFLWNSPPDDRLLELAKSNSLRQSLDAEIDRLIQDMRFQQFTDEFASQWLSLDKLDVVEIDRNRFPTLTRDTRKQLRREPVHFLHYLIQQNLTVSHLVQSDFIVANDVVANYYGLTAETNNGFEFAAVRHQDENLGGVLTQAGILAGLSNGRESNPVKRGAWLARKIIAKPPDDPPPNVPALPEDEESDLTLRQKLERHRNQKGCAKCHEGIDPWGIPFEQFDAGGLYVKDRAVEATSVLPDQTEVKSLRELKRYLAEDRIDQVAFSFLKHVASYAVGRTLTWNEIEFLRNEGLELKTDGYSMKDMLRFVIHSDLFMKK